VSWHAGDAFEYSLVLEEKDILGGVVLCLALQSPSETHVGLVEIYLECSSDRCERLGLLVRETGPVANENNLDSS
jgi:hypothetical protein